MAQVIQASELTLHDVKEKFNLQRVEDEQFFPEWQNDLPQATDAEKQWLDRVKANFLYLAEYPMHEEIVKMVVLSPLLSLANFYSYPFRPVAEKPVEIVFEDEAETLRGRIDVLVLHQTLWITVIEAKRKQLNVLEGIPQALFYMMNRPTIREPLFGFITNGSEFVYLKLMQQDSPRYGLSRLFSLINPGNDLYTVLGVLKRLGEVVNSTKR
ncbi:Type I restriction enzyme R protein N terminal domain protein [Coleofasciculus chthonoplastes PCC 7420]|uniref:Type I restriction enzyme R protein N terminal domain protein n=1 Tax=Coleofasciculus chthonoplastes PCC 7420 TaxID=118168 RepID=B4W3E3_9CYAN|nr:type I restriction enzyme HsdR N-terminal domain-containing protein [Coleofasciculus chthonoplastes]EDX71315.1 Type I restriction enzyme R protein N terminal domain protein [Coleofasciculus chthonoplastes PCC 7420]